VKLEECPDFKFFIYQFCFYQFLLSICTIFHLDLVEIHWTDGTEQKLWIVNSWWQCF